MKKIIVLALPIFFLSLLSSYSEAASRSEAVLQKMDEAKILLAGVELSVETKTETRTSKKKVKSKKTGKLVWVSYPRKVEFISSKEIALAAWDTVEDKLHIVRLIVPYSYSVAFSFQVLSSGYEVEHIAGRGPSKLIFAVKKNGRKLLALSYKHWWISPGHSNSDDPKIFEKYAEEIIYSPYAPDLYDEESILKGADFLFNEIVAVKLELQNKGVPSRAYPDKLLSEIIENDYLFNLAHNEQMDHGKFEADANLTAEEISIEYALNGKNAFRWIASEKYARGSFQFTNNGRGKNLGTYDYVVRECTRADLIKDFTAGTQDLRNMIKAAICLLDLELSKMPKEVRDLYLVDYRIGSVYPSICYNGGCGKAFTLYNWLRRNKKELKSDSFEFPVSSIGHPETHTYIRKQAFLWGYTDRIKEKLRNYQKGQQ
ncbi:MAG: hypothetical protein Q7S12_01110 [bacterium]|nr:hypothetical protein [bacterium]